tara:strand:+ start:501 stop:1013 length:513 start_codon:yes stop_codon:yes gene_type:complete
MASELHVDTIKDSGGTSNVHIAGAVLQVQSTTKTDDFTMSSQTYADVTGLSVVITPKFNTSKIFVSYVVHCMNSGSGMHVQVVRGSTAILNGTGTGTVSSDVGLSFEEGSSTQESVSHQFLDSPATTSATTYKIQVRRNATGNGTAAHVNRDLNGASKSSSTITVMEIAQ